jgi:hypothetical protein
VAWLDQISQGAFVASPANWKPKGLELRFALEFIPSTPFISHLSITLSTSAFFSRRKDQHRTVSQSHIMGDVLLETPVDVAAPAHRKTPLSSMPNIDTLEGISADGGDEYATMKKLQRQLE